MYGTTKKYKRHYGIFTLIYMYVSAFSQYCISYSVRKSGMECNLVVWQIVTTPPNLILSITHMYVCAKYGYTVKT